MGLKRLKIQLIILSVFLLIGKLNAQENDPYNPLSDTLAKTSSPKSRYTDSNKNKSAIAGKEEQYKKSKRAPRHRKTVYISKRFPFFRYGKKAWIGSPSEFW